MTVAPGGEAGRPNQDTHTHTARARHTVAMAVRPTTSSAAGATGSGGAKRIPSTKKPCATNQPSPRVDSSPSFTLACTCATI